MENKIETDLFFRRRNVLLIWRDFNESKGSTEFWDKEKFEYFLDNEDSIINFHLSEFDGKLFIDPTVNWQKEQTSKLLDKLKVIYNERFKPENEEIDFSEYLPTAPQKVKVMYELGIFELLNKIPELKGNDTNISKIISAIIGINTDTIRKPYLAIKNNRDTSGYNLNSDKNEKAINKLYNDLGIKRKVK